MTEFGSIQIINSSGEGNALRATVASIPTSSQTLPTRGSIPFEGKVKHRNPLPLNGCCGNQCPWYRSIKAALSFLVKVTMSVLLLLSPAISPAMYNAADLTSSQSLLGENSGSMAGPASNVDRFV